MVRCSTERVILIAVSALKTVNTTSSRPSRVTEVPLSLLLQGPRLAERSIAKDLLRGPLTCVMRIELSLPMPTSIALFDAQATVLSSQSKGLGASNRPLTAQACLSLGLIDTPAPHGHG